MPGLFQSPVLAERFYSAVTVGNLAQPFVAPCDLEVISLVGRVGTAPGAGNTFTVNVNVTPTSQQVGLPSGVTAIPSYNLWSSANVPTISGTSTTTFVTSASDADLGTLLLLNEPYALNYPLPGPLNGPYTDGTGVSGFYTAQSTSQQVQEPVVSPPPMYEYGMTTPVRPDAQYNDINGISQPTYWVHAGDVLTFTVGGTVGSAADLSLVLYSQHM